MEAAWFGATQQQDGHTKSEHVEHAHTLHFLYEYCTSTLMGCTTEPAELKGGRKWCTSSVFSTHVTRGAHAHTHTRARARARLLLPTADDKGWMLTDNADCVSAQQVHLQSIGHPILNDPKYNGGIKTDLTPAPSPPPYTLEPECKQWSIQIN